MPAEACELRDQEAMTDSMTHPAVLVCGEALFDVFPAAGGPEQGAWPMTARAGGSPFNVAIGLARLGRSTAFLGGLSTDPMGQALVAQLVRERVDAGLSPRLANRTTLSLVARDPSGHPAYAFYGEGGADRSLTSP
jgi:fructokinase